MRKFTPAILLLLFLASGLYAQQFNYPGIAGKAGMNLIDSKATGVQILHAVPAFTLDDFVVDGKPVKNINLPGTILFNETGMPNLPGKGKYIAIPQGSTPNLRIVSQKTETIYNVDIAPAPRIPLDNDDRPLDFTKNMQVYGKNAFYPESPVSISEIDQVRGVDAVILGITPFQYNPVTKELIVYTELQVEIAFEGGNGKFGNEAFRSAWWDPILEDQLLNYTSLPVIDYSARVKSFTDAPLDDECEYIIICPTGESFLSWADSIKKFRTEQGILTKVFTVDEVGGNTEAAIEAFIDNAYLNWTIKPAACLLLADYGSDGSKNITSHLYSHPAGYPNYASDNKYADVTGDEMPDVVFSRITANDAAQLEVMVTKFLDYERTPPVNPRFYNKPITALGWQTDRWFQLCSEIVGGYFRNVQGKEPRRINAVVPGYTPGSIWSTATNTNTIVSYFGPSGLQYIPQSPAELGGWYGGNATMINNAIDSGAFMLQHRDHGNYNGWGDPEYEITNINQLTNTDLTFVFSINCQTGAFQRSSECFGEHFHRYTKNGHNSGALGVVCPTEVSYSFVNDCFVWGMYDNMWPDFMPEEGTTPPSRGVLPAFGAAAGKYFLKQSSWPYNTSDKLVTYRLFHMHGDAFQLMYTEVPVALTVSHDQEVPYGNTTFTVTANIGSLIALTSGSTILATANGAGSTPVVMNIPVLPVGSQVVVTVTKHNYYRYRDAVTVTSTNLIADFAASTTTICTGNGTSFTDMTNLPPETWSWEFPGGNPATSNEQNPANIQYATSGNYDVSLTVTKTGVPSNTMTKTAYIHVTNNPTAAFTSEGTCIGTDIQFTDASDSNGGLVDKWEWNFGDPSSSSNTSTLQNPTHNYATAGTYNVKLVAYNSGICADSIFQEVIIIGNPGVAAVPTGLAAVCKDASGIEYTTTGSADASLYLWTTFPETAGTFTGNTATATLALTSGYIDPFQIKVKGLNVCGEGEFSEAFNVSIIDIAAAPEKPEGADSVNLNKIDQTDFTLVEVPGAESYAWSITPEEAGTLSGTGLTGTAVWSKSYKGVVSITAKTVNTCGQSIASEPKEVTLYAPVGMNENNGMGIEVFPNPTSGKFNLDITSGSLAKISIKIYNVLGNIVFVENDVQLNGKLHKTIDISTLPKGIYHLKVEGDNTSVIKRIVIEK
jgi:PKD repeat protein